MKAKVTDNYFPHENKRKRVIFSLFLLSFISLFIYFLTSLQFQFLYLESTGESNGKKALFPLRAGEEFTLKYIHSVDLLPVYEIYFNKGQYIYLKETHFYNFGAGMGLLEGRGTYKEENGTLKVVDINEIIEPFILRLGKTANQQLYHRGKNYVLQDYFGTGAKLSIEVRNMCGFMALKELIQLMILKLQ